VENKKLFIRFIILYPISCALVSLAIFGLLSSVASFIPGFSEQQRIIILMIPIGFGLLSLFAGILVGSKLYLSFRRTERAQREFERNLPDILLMQNVPNEEESLLVLVKSLRGDFVLTASYQIIVWYCICFFGVLDLLAIVLRCAQKGFPQNVTECFDGIFLLVILILNLPVAVLFKNLRKKYEFDGHSIIERDLFKRVTNELLVDEIVEASVRGRSLLLVTPNKQMNIYIGKQLKAELSKITDPSRTS
jgi:hypothetical protein